MKKNKKKSSNNILKKIGRGLYRFISLIYNLIDSFIIMPITRFFVWILKLIKTNNKPFDRLLNNKIFLITFSLAIALFSFFYIDRNADKFTNNSADILYNQPVNALYNEEAYVIEGLPETVDITLIGRRADLYLAKQYPSEEVVVDLRDYKPGTHEVSLKYNGSVSSVQYKLTPSVATVIIYEKMSVSKSITKELLYESKLDSKYIINNVTFDRDEVFVKGAEYKLEQVASVRALVDVRKIVDPSSGTATLKEVPLAAYDENGKKLDVEIVPSSVTATIQISSPSKKVPLKVVPEGEVVFGKAIDEVTLSEENVTVYAPESVLEGVSFIPVKINVNNLKNTKEFTINLDKPAGVKDMSVRSVVAKVTLSDIAEKVVKGINVSTRNLGTDYVAQAASEADSAIDVIVKGTDSTLSAVTSDNITAYVDLKGLKEGTHKVNVEVTGDDLKLTYTPKKTTVTIVIRKK
jgi:Uncharacterized protein conserved in bacteria